MNKFTKGVCAALLALGVLNTNAQTKTSAKGMKYQFHKDVEGKAGVVGEIAKFYIKISTADGMVLQDSKAMSLDPQVDMVKEAQFPWSYEEVFTMANAGDSVSVYIPSDSIFSPKFGQQRPPSIAEHSDLIFTFNIVGFVTMAEYEKEMEAKSMAMRMEQDVVLQEYIKKHKLKTTKTENGLYYAVTKAGTGAKPQSGDKVKVHYTGRLIDSTKFDSSVDRGQPFDFELGAHQVIQGWDDGIALMKKGEKGILLIPSHLGYGERGAGGNIGPNSILIFDVELVDFESKNPAPVAKPSTTPAKKSTVNVKKEVSKPSTKPVTKKKTELK
ncbi:MAG: FKBP-type peptidyl-prolyl cis-trans isomerase [Cytophagales bacterium]